MSSLKAIHGNFISEVRHDLLEPFASAQMGSVFPSSCLNPKSGKQARNGFQGSILRFEDGSTWICPPNDSVSFPRPGEARQTEVELVPMEGGQTLRVEAAALDCHSPAVLLGVLSSSEAGSSAEPLTQRRGARAGTIVCVETGAPWTIRWPQRSAALIQCR